MKLTQRDDINDDMLYVVNRSSALGATIVCYDSFKASEYWNLARRMGRKIPPIVIHSKYLYSKGEGIDSAILDDADRLLSRIASHVMIEEIIMAGSRDNYE